MSDTETTPDETDAIVEAFHDALDAIHYSGHGREHDWIDGSAEGVVHALLTAGWTPPAPAFPKPVVERNTQ